MLYHAKIPLKFWVDAFVTANYIVNILPTQKLQMQSPFSKLYQHNPRYDHLRTFGCACYPCLRPYAQNKLDPRSLTCVFLGYSDHYKGYRCLLPTTGHVYISRHVVFDENFFPFSQKLATVYPSYTHLYKLWIEEEQFLASSTTNHTTPSTSQYTDWEKEATMNHTNGGISPEYTEQAVSISPAETTVERVSITAQDSPQQIEVASSITYED